LQYDNSRLADYTEEPAGAGGVDLPFALLVVLLLTIGVIMVLSASFASAYYDPAHETGGNPTYYFARQLVFALGGIGVMFLCSKFPPSFYRQISGIVMLAALGTLLAVLVIGSKVNGARRWIDLGFTTFQPSEIAKIAVILYFSALICRYKDRMRSFRHGILPFAGILLLIAALLIAEPHLSATIIILAIGAVMLFIGGARLYWFVGGATILSVVAFVVVRFFPYASARITTWRDPFSDLTGDGWQIVQSLYAIGSGGLMGLGLGQSRQKYLYLPEEHNDFIFSVLSEELGLIGALLVLALFVLLIVRGYWLAMHTRDRYSFLVGTGITTLLALQVFLNVAVCTNLIPATGISLPFFSYGGTALLIQMAEMGVMLSISRDIPMRK
jgi:cell division protein FtsW